MQPLISVIMPVYRVEKYLECAVQSVCAQTASDWEMILVDDASPDGCGRMCDEFAARDSRISVIHLQENGGLSNARNVGMSRARGKYIFFMDSDDRIDERLFEKAEHSIEEDSPQVVVWGVTEEHYSADGTLSERREVCADRRECRDVQAVRLCALELEHKGILGYAWNKLYSRELLERSGVCFEKVPLIEDILFNLLLLPHIERMQVLSRPLYFYARRTEGSLTHRFIPDYYPLSMRRVEEMLGLYEEWGMGDEAKRVLAPIYVRYTLSALARNCDVRAHMNMNARLKFVRAFRESGLHMRLMQEMKSAGGVHGMLSKLIAGGNGWICLLMGRAIFMVQHGMAGLFLRLSRRGDA